MKAQRGSRRIEWIYSFFNLGARLGAWLTPEPGRFIPREWPGTHFYDL